MHRDEVKIFRGNVETHVERLREFDRLRATDPEATPLGRLASSAQPQRLLEYEPSAEERRRRHIRKVIATAIDDTLGFTLLGAILAFCAGYGVSDTKPDGLWFGATLAAAALWTGLAWTYALARRRLRRHPNDS